MSAPSTDPSLWERRPVHGVAGGPDEIRLTREGMELAFSVGAKARRGGPAEALEALHAAGGTALLVVREGARLNLTVLGRLNRLAWTHLGVHGLGYVELFIDAGGEGVRLTIDGWTAAKNGIEERERLLGRCRRAAVLEGVSEWARKAGSGK